MASRIPHITVCICTFKRPALLGQILEELRSQQTEGRFTYSIVITDNDRSESAREVNLVYKPAVGAISAIT